MRIKLRLYPRDLDLITLRQNKSFNFTKALRNALVEYVKNGYCERIFLPNIQASVVLRNEVVDCQINEDEYPDLVTWINSMAPGMRSAAIKTVFRSAIATPQLYAFNSHFVLQVSRELQEKTKANQHRAEEKKASAAQNSQDNIDAKTQDEVVDAEENDTDTVLAGEWFEMDVNY